MDEGGSYLKVRDTDTDSALGDINAAKHLRGGKSSKTEVRRVCVKGRASFILSTQFCAGSRVHFAALFVCFFPAMVSSPAPLSGTTGCDWPVGGGRGSCRGEAPGRRPAGLGSMVLSRPCSVLFGQLLLDVEKKLVVGERRFGTVLDQVLEEIALC